MPIWGQKDDSENRQATQSSQIKYIKYLLVTAEQKLSERKIYIYTQRQ